MHILVCDDDAAFAAQIDEYISEWFRAREIQVQSTVCTSGEQLVQRLRARGVLLRGCANYPGLGPGWYRAAVRTHSENSAFLQALGEVL